MITSKPMAHRLFACRIVSGVTALLIIGFATLAGAQGSLPEVEPERLWHGAEFADATAAWLKANAPELRVHAPVARAKSEFVFSASVPTREEIFADRDTVINIDKPGGVRVKTLGDLIATGLLSADLRGLGETLYLGGQIHYAGEEAAMKEREGRLRAWILSRPDASIAPHELLGRAIVMTEGNSLKALAIVWNVLSKDWEAAATRNANVITSKLVDMTGEASLRDATGRFIIVDKDQATEVKAARRDDSSEGITRRKMKDRVRFVITKRGDKFSTYYHFFGVMLMSSYVSARYGGGFWGSLFGKTGALMEAMKHVETSGLKGERDKRVANDLQGAEAGARFHRLIGGASPRPIEGDLTRYYAKPDPRFRGNYAVPAGMPAAYYGIKSDPKYWTGPMSVEELTIRFNHALWRSQDIFNPFILATSADGDRLVVGLGDYAAALRAGKPGDPVLNQLIMDYQKGFRGAAYRASKQDFNLYRDGELERHVRSQFPDYEIDKNYRIFSELARGIADLVRGRGRTCRAIFR